MFIVFYFLLQKVQEPRWLQPGRKNLFSIYTLNTAIPILFYESLYHSLLSLPVNIILCCINELSQTQSIWLHVPSVVPAQDIILFHFKISIFSPKICIIFVTDLWFLYFILPCQFYIEAHYNITYWLQQPSKKEVAFPAPSS